VHGAESVNTHSTLGKPKRREYDCCQRVKGKVSGRTVAFLCSEEGVLNQVRMKGGKEWESCGPFMGRGKPHHGTQKMQDREIHGKVKGGMQSPRLIL